MRLISNPMRAKVPMPHRELLHRYVAVLNVERKRQGLRLVSPAEVAGAMICFILDTHQQSILDGYETLRTGAFLEKYGSLLGGDGPKAAQVPDV